MIVSYIHPDLFFTENYFSFVQVLDEWVKYLHVEPYNDTSIVTYHMCHKYK